MVNCDWTWRDPNGPDLMGLHVINYGPSKSSRFYSHRVSNWLSDCGGTSELALESKEVNVAWKEEPKDIPQATNCKPKKQGAAKKGGKDRCSWIYIYRRWIIPEGYTIIIWSFWHFYHFFIGLHGAKNTI
jgi:hypothetical protein